MMKNLIVFITLLFLFSVNSPLFASFIVDSVSKTGDVKLCTSSTVLKKNVVIPSTAGESKFSLKFKPKAFIYVFDTRFKQQGKYGQFFIQAKTNYPAQNPPCVNITITKKPDGSAQINVSRNDVIVEFRGFPPAKITESPTKTRSITAPEEKSSESAPAKKSNDEDQPEKLTFVSKREEEISILKTNS